MSDVDTTEERDAEVEQQTSDTPVADAVNEFQPQGTVLYPETDAVRAALSGGIPAGNADTVPPGTTEIQAALDEQAAAQEANAEYQVGNARDFRWELEGGGEPNLTRGG